MSALGIKGTTKLLIVLVVVVLWHTLVVVFLDTRVNEQMETAQHSMATAPETVPPTLPPVPNTSIIRSVPNTTNHKSAKPRSGVPSRAKKQPPRLGFAVIGFAKCGTTTLGRWLQDHPQIMSFHEENYNMRNVGQLQQDLRALATNATNLTKHYGYRCPHDVQLSEVMLTIGRRFPQTKLIVSIRHPVRWFESFYNYQVEMNKFFLLRGTPNELIGDLLCNSKGDKQFPCPPIYLSTGTGAFHRYLASMKKTPLSDSDELAVLQPYLTDQFLLHGPKIPNEVFLLETTQLGDQNQTRISNLRKDLQNYLGLDSDLPLPPLVRPVDKGKKADQEVVKMDICHTRYTPVRTELMKISRNASLWIRQYFLHSDDVTVSSHSYLEELLQTWMVDPCTSSVM